MAIGDNNPRVFAETIALDAWRTKFDGERGEADLHIDVVFGAQGRVGGEGSPVRFRVSIKRAEVHVMRDNEGIIDIKRSSVRRADLEKPSERKKIHQESAELEGAGEVSISEKSPSFLARIKGKGKVEYSEKTEKNESISPIKVTHWKTDKGYAFRIEAVAESVLKGQPWHANEPVMKILDTNVKRKRGEPPEVRIELHCLREDLIIEDIEFTESKFPPFLTLGRKKQIAVEQYLRDELARAGFPCSDINEPFARIILADVMPSIER